MITRFHGIDKLGEIFYHLWADQVESRGALCYVIDPPILTQSIYHISNSSPTLRKYYEDLVERRGAGRARIALIRKICGTMRSMLLTGECYRWMNDVLFERKLKAYEKVLKKIKMERKIA